MTDPAALAQLQSRLRDKAKAFDGYAETGDYEPSALATAQLLRAAATALDQHVATARALEEARKHPSAEWDNHHNALKCPYCNPDKIDLEGLAAHIEAMRKSIDERDTRIAGLEADREAHAEALKAAQQEAADWRLSFETANEALAKLDEAEAQVAALTAELAQPHERQKG